ncbi:hypothetical protein ADU37_CDS04320 [Thermococcus sp. 2319x1]|uniref:DUF2067 family protein n=1 Tax=Thermococcus sp. 2319x1 TaxID=1674923 RepID=UPI00073AC31F|nr:DUF2067 family protein [Thermococcus sp. 2319x1]ALV62131.1 hypothetical protein ADU37_CDS04320 [Thermococcus sp. 2319x1]
MKAKKVMVIHVRDEVEKEELMKELQKLELPAFVYVHGRLNSLKINIQGTKDEIREAMQKIREIHQRVRSRLYPDRRGFYQYNIDDIFREAGTSVSVPVLLKTLELLGEKAELRDNRVISSLPWNEIVELTKKLGEALSEIALQTTRQIREVVLPIAVAFELEPEEVLDIALELGVAEYREDKFKYELIKNKEQALEIMLKKLTGGENED